ncbi:hypothetical protein HPB51_002504 [Rhipicephalus microplus]|uniref:Uncharacterized protein n=1 Tax=Rhipicephalus microplus TaxID=6941 RepID=A0A9J6DF03_RHIMP|nr:hypothetical protein HPB51_002504 [Rhipicephalus microplus]
MSCTAFSTYRLLFGVRAACVSSIEMEVEQQPVGDPAGATGGGTAPGFDAFLQTGRTGRRNALPDILEEGATNVSTASLPCSFQKLSCSGKTRRAADNPAT